MSDHIQGDLSESEDIRIVARTKAEEQEKRILELEKETRDLWAAIHDLYRAGAGGELDLLEAP